MLASPERAAAWAAAIVSALVGVADVASAQAQAPAESARRVELHLEDCLGADAAAARRILAAELGEVSIVVDEADDSDRDDVTVTHAACGVESAIVVVSHARGDIRVERRVNLAGAAPSTRTRLLALSIAEQVAAVWAAVDALPPEPEPDPEPIAQPEPEPPVPALPRRRLVRAPDPEPPAPPARPLGLRAIGVVRVSGSPVHISYGGGLGIESALPFLLGVGADFRYEQGEADVGALGRVALRTTWGTLLALVRPVVGWSSLTIGVGAKLGAAWLQGLPASGVAGSTHAGLVAGPAVVAQVALHVGGSGYVHLGLELSWITLGVSGLNGATGETIASFTGPQLAITAGFEIQPSR